MCAASVATCTWLIYQWPGITLGRQRPCLVSSPPPPPPSSKLTPLSPPSGTEPQLVSGQVQRHQGGGGEGTLRGDTKEQWVLTFRPQSFSWVSVSLSRFSLLQRHKDGLRGYPRKKTRQQFVDIDVRILATARTCSSTFNTQYTLHNPCEQLINPFNILWRQNSVLFGI